MFSAGLKFALGLGAGCLLIYAVGLGFILLWFKAESAWKRRRLMLRHSSATSGADVPATPTASQASRSQVLQLKRPKSSVNQGGGK